MVCCPSTDARQKIANIVNTMVAPVRSWPRAALLSAAILTLISNRQASVAVESFVAVAKPNLSQRRLNSIQSKVSVQPKGSTCLYSFRALHDELCSMVGSRFGLQRTDFCDVVGGSNWQDPNSGASGSATWWSESSPNFLTGVTTATMQRGSEELYTINIWMGPSYDVPHLLLSFGTSKLIADYVPRGGNVLGSDPQYLSMYFENPDVQSAYTQAYFSGASQPLLPPPELETRLLFSPSRIAVSGLSSETVTSLARQHVTRFLSWVDQSQPIPARSRGAFNLRDDKLRQYYFRGQVQQQIRESNNADLGRMIAASITGPVAEAYVGGGS
jgi:hypothetical protein